MTGNSPGSSSPAGPLSRRHRVTIEGADGPFLVMMHGFGTDQTVWDRIVPGLRDRYRIVRLDMAGAGPNSAQTFDPRRYAEVEAHADDLLAVVNEIGIERCGFIGASVGAMIGVLAAIEQPKLFRQLIALGASPRYLNDGAYIGGFDRPSLDGLFAAMSSDYHGWVSGFAPVAVRGLPESEAVAEFARSLFALRPDIAISSARAIFESDFRDRLSLIQTPTAILQMPNDIAVPLHIGAYLNEHIAGSALEVIPAEGHFPHLSAPAVVLDAFRRHLN